MSKQDRQGPRTPAQLEQRYRFGQTFAEAMGLAKEAKETADEAVGAAKAAAKEEVENMSQEDVFNKLTSNGAVKGLFMQDGQLYINASYLKSGKISAELIDTVNLIAQKLLSASGDSEMQIDGAQLLFSVAGQTAMEMYTEDGAPILYMFDRENGSIVDTMEISPHHLKLGGNSMMPAVYFSGSDGVAKLCLNGGSLMEIFWKDNGDGTYTLMGR